MKTGALSLASDVQVVIFEGDSLKFAESVRTNTNDKSEVVVTWQRIQHVLPFIPN